MRIVWLVLRALPNRKLSSYHNITAADVGAGRSISLRRRFSGRQLPLSVDVTKAVLLLLYHYIQADVGN